MATIQTTIPEELHDKKQWTYSYSQDEIKRPKHSHYTPDGGLLLSTAMTKATTLGVSYGFYTTLADPYFLGDVDHLDDPADAESWYPEIKNFLLDNNFYIEISPSGQGLRFIGKFPAADIKDDVWGSNFFLKEPINDSLRTVQFNIAPPWMRMTGNTVACSGDTVPTVPLSVLDALFKIPRKSEMEDMGGATHVAPKSDIRMPSLMDMRRAIKSIPLNQNPRVIRGYKHVFGSVYQHYEFWLKVLMGMHDYGNRTGTLAECFQAVLDWSRQDASSFKGDADVLTKWKYLSSKPNPISYHSVLALGWFCVLRFPSVKYVEGKKGKPDKSFPISTEFSNFRALVDYYDLKLYVDAVVQTKHYITGDPDIMAKYFESGITQYFYGVYRGPFSEKALIAAFHIMMQDHGFIGIGHPTILQFIRDWCYQINLKLDLIRLYFNTPFEELPLEYQENRDNFTGSTVDAMFDCLVVEYLTKDRKKEELLYRKFYKSWLMGLVRSIYWPDDPHMNHCILLLTGREQIRKTSHFRYMLPKFMREDLIAFTTHGFATESSMRDLTKLASTNLLLVWDELEQHLNSKTEDSFKKLIDSTPNKFIDKYETFETRVKPRCLYGATSNQREFQLSDNGSRRLFHIPVSWVHTDRLDKICWWKIVSDLKKEMELWTGDDPIWLLTREELNYQSMLHGKIQAKTGLDMVLEDLFDFSKPCPMPVKGGVWDVNMVKDRVAVPLKSIITVLTTKGGMEAFRINRVHLTKTLHRLCGVWSNTRRTTVYFTRPRMSVKDGLCTYSGHQLWIMPPVKTGFEGSVEEEEEDVWEI